VCFVVSFVFAVRKTAVGAIVSMYVYFLPYEADANIDRCY